MPGIIESVREQLIENADEKTKESGKKFFKEEVRLYGVKTATVTKIGNQVFKLLTDMPKGEIFELCT